jgi:hypothetical protein
MSRKDTDAGLVDELKVDKDCAVDRSWIADYTKSIVDICRQYGVKAVQIRMCPSRRNARARVRCFFRNCSNVFECNQEFVPNN